MEKLDSSDSGPIVLDLAAVDRETALKSWLVYHRLGCSDLAASIGVAPSTISRVITGERRSAKTISGLVALGVPRELLPSGE
ncbi:MAG: helix-turn-helix domain-containing protein [Desulfovibrionaceae bacterium]